MLKYKINRVNSTILIISTYTIEWLINSLIPTKKFNNNIFFHKISLKSIGTMIKTINLNLLLSQL